MKHYVHPFYACLQEVSVQLVIVGMRHLSLRLVCIIVGPSWSKSAVQDKVSQQGAFLRPLWSKSAARDKVLGQGAVPEALVVKVRHARQSPMTRSSFLRPSVFKVHCARQSPPMRASS
jgi:hypothetical protein